MCLQTHVRPAVSGVLLACALALGGWNSAYAQKRPNILWLTSEDNGPALGAYGDDYATTPNLDRLAERGQLYLNAWSNAPVCAPARTAIITGVYPPSTGGQHMRSQVRLPDGMPMFPQLLRAVGYYTTNNAKEDYNVEKPGQVWDDSSSEAHWRNRPEGAPFFAVFNFGISHESRIRQRPHEPVHNPAGVRVPAYHPDTPEVRRDWAQYYDRITEMDVQVGERLAELEEAGLVEDTIVVYFGDHGVGLPRGKRSLLDSGLRVPLIIHVPRRFRALAGEDYAEGTETAHLAGFVDLAPTMLSLAGIRPPEYMHGSAMLGPFRASPPEYLHGFRGRMDERYDFSRGVRNQRYLYVRNYAPHRIYGQFVWYMFQTPTTQVWKALNDAGRLEPPQTFFWETKPAEELYDLERDPDEVANLASSPEHQATLQRFRGVLRDHLLSTRDLGFLSEPEMHLRAGGGAPYDLGQDEGRYPLSEILEVAEIATRPSISAGRELTAALGHSDSAVRYWGAVGLLIRGASAVEGALFELRRALGDGSTSVQVAAAEALGRYGAIEEDVEAAVAVLVARANLDTNDLFTTMLALNALDYLDERAAGVVDVLRELPREREGMRRQFQRYVPQLLDKILADLE